MLSRFFLSCFLFASTLSYAKPSKPIKAALGSSVQVVIPEESMGSGVVLMNYKEGVLIATNDHVCQGTRGRVFSTNELNMNKPTGTLPIYVEGVDGIRYVAKILMTSNVNTRKSEKKADLCLLYVKSKLSPIVISKDRIEIGDKLFIVSGPGGIFPLITEGYAGRTFSDKVVKDVRATTLQVNHGSSGGGVFNEAGELVGIIFSITVDSENGSPIASFMIELSDLKDFIKVALEKYPDAK